MNSLIMTATVFAICSLINVMLNTVKSLIMYDKKWLSSANINMITYGFYTIIVVMMAGDMPLWIKVIVTALTNWVGVACSVKFMNYLEKDKLWKIECTVEKNYTRALHNALDSKNIPHNYIENVGKYVLFNIYSETQKESIEIKEILKRYKVKYFVSESKTL